MTVIALVLLWAALNLVALIAINRYRDSLEQADIIRRVGGRGEWAPGSNAAGEPPDEEVIAHIGRKQLRRTPTYLGRLHRDGRIEGKWLP